MLRGNLVKRRRDFVQQVIIFFKKKIFEKNHQFFLLTSLRLATEGNPNSRENRSFDGQLRFKLDISF